MDNNENKRTNAEIHLLIERNIVLPIERLGGTLSNERRIGLQEMTLLELNQLAIDLQNLETSSRAITTVVRAIAASQQNRYEDDAKRVDELIGPAHVDMDLRDV